MHRLKVLLALVAAIGLITAVGVRAQEHPKEHPQKEHPAPKPITTADVEKHIRATIKKAEAGGGRFQVQDNVLNKSWSLELVKVHTDKLTQLDETTFFACVDFKAEDGTLVDVDFFLKNEGGKLKFSDTTVHKLNGKARYMYEQKGNFWVRVPAGS